MADESWRVRAPGDARSNEAIRKEQIIREAIEYWVGQAIDHLDAFDRRDGVEPDGDEFEDDEGQYYRLGSPIPAGSLEDDEPD